jgi:hypothetical protein
LVDQVGSAAAFFALGVGLQVAAILGLVFLFRRRRWL